MKWSKKICYGLLLVFSIMFGSLLNVSSDVSAVSDISVSYSQSTTVSNGQDVFIDCSDFDCLSQFSYLIVTSSFYSPSINYSIGYKYPMFQLPVSFTLNYVPLIIFSLPSDIQSLTFTSNKSLSREVSFTLSSSLPNCSTPSSGSLSISENGTYDVSQYAEAVVNVPPEVVQGDYHDDLVSINNSILIVAAVGLVIYFFYAIYRMILGGRR